MKERPILFSAPMVRAILDGSKTQTRRIVKMKTPKVRTLLDYSVDGLCVGPCPQGNTGDRLWVRETFGLLGDEEQHVLHYRATHPRAHVTGWTPSIHMPRRASRITLEITGVRVERLNDIGQFDAAAEGVIPDDEDFVGAFMALWESIAGPGSWDANPWVWVIEFKRMEQEQ